MEKNYDTDDFLAKWASGALSEEQKEAFRQSEDYKYYEAILGGTELLDVPAYDRETLFNRVSEKIEKEKKPIRLIPRWAYAVAASVALFLGYLYINNQNSVFETSFGEQLVISLPDASEVILNASSELQYHKKNYLEERLLSLKGEAYFKVNKGVRFMVQTSNGSVTVLGTRFIVNTDAGIFEVQCYEGKVKVEKDDTTEILTKGEAVRFKGAGFEKWSVITEDPTWLQEESSFTNAPLKHVISALEKQFNITIDDKGIKKGLRFSGSFTHTDLKKALRTVFEPLDLTFIFVNERQITLSEN